MTLGRGLESLIPPQQPFNNNQPQDDLGEVLKSANPEQVRGEEARPPGADTSRTEHPAGSLGLVPDHSVGTSEPREKKVRPLESDYSGSDRGISADDRTERSIIFQIETDKIAPNPHQPRRDFDAQSLQELANSIREFGVIQPLIVTKIERESERGWDVSYELVAGERRVMAS